MSGNCGDSGRCQRCESITDRGAGPYDLYVLLPLGHTSGKFSAACRRAGVICEADAFGVSHVRVTLTQLDALRAETDNRLTLRERRETQAILCPAGTPPDARLLQWLISLEGALRQRDLMQFRHIVRDGGLYNVSQPIFRLADRQQMGQELLMRGRADDGAEVSPGWLIDLARSADLLFQLDLEARLMALRSTARANLSGLVFVNFIPTALYDPAFCLRSTFEVLEALRLDPRQFVFEVVETEQIDDLAGLRHILDEYRGQGCQVALDDVGAGFVALDWISELRPDFIKLDGKLVRAAPEDALSAGLLAKLVEIAHGVGAAVLAEGIETPEQEHWVTAMGADLGQGFGLARPQPLPDLTG